MARIDNGEFTTHEDLEKEMDSWDTPIPGWQINEVRKRKEYYTQHPDELIDWEDAQKMTNAD